MNKELRKCEKSMLIKTYFADKATRVLATLLSHSKRPQPCWRVLPIQRPNQLTGSLIFFFFAVMVIEFLCQWLFHPQVKWLPQVKFSITTVLIIIIVATVVKVIIVAAVVKVIRAATVVVFVSAALFSIVVCLCWALCLTFLNRNILTILPGKLKLTC